MKTATPISPPRSKQRQRGAALLIAMLIVVLGLVTLLTFRSDRKGPELEAERKTALALAQAKAALLGRAASDNDPGTLSCPSINLSGIANSSGADCASAIAPSIIPKYAGRFPWKTLDSGDLYDGVGERLWYVMSPNFVDKGKAVIPATLGTISLNGGPNVIVAVIIAPGSVRNGQDRSAGNETVMANYLESYVDGATINTVLPPGNDRVIAISAAELFNLVVQRMAREFALEVSVELNATGEYPESGWLPTSANWTTSHFKNWGSTAATEFTKLSSTKGALRFPPCIGEFTIQKTEDSDAAVTGKVAC